MKHKLSILSLITIVCILITGCSNSSKECDEINRCQEKMLTQTSAHLKVISTVKSEKRNEMLTTDFIYKMNANGIMEYSEAQLDSTNKMIFCEVSDGKKAEQWLLGKGWGMIDATNYTKEKPHRYLSALTTKLDEKTIETASIAEQEANKLYTFCLNADVLNKTIYTNTATEIISQELTFLINAEGNIICYTDNAVILDKEANQEATYTLEIQVSEQGAITEILKPELRANAAIEQDITTQDIVEEEK